MHNVNLQFLQLSWTELEELYDSLEDRSFRREGEDTDEYRERLRGLIREIEHIVIHASELKHTGRNRLRRNAGLQEKIAPLLALRRRVMDELMFMASDHEEYLALEQFNKFVGMMETDDCHILPKGGFYRCRCFITDDNYGSDFNLMTGIIQMVQPKNFKDIYDDIPYSESSIDAFEGMNLCESVREMHRRLYSLPDLTRINTLSVTKTKTMNTQKEKLLKLASFISAALLMVYAAYAICDFLAFIFGGHPNPNALKIQLATRYAWMGIHMLALLPIALMFKFASRVEGLEREVKELKEIKSC